MHLSDMDTPTADLEPPNSNEISIKRRRKKSIVWEYFTIETVDASCKRACCKQCKKSFAYITGTRLAGTSHLKRHIALGICPVGRLNRENNQENPFSLISKPSNVPRKRFRANPGVGIIPFDQNRSNYELAKMVMLQSLPLNIAEQPGFIDFIRTLQPEFSMVKSDKIEENCMSIYMREKQSLLNILSGVLGRVSLTIDLWTSDQTVGYAILTGHFVDADYKLNRRILNVAKVSFPNSETSLHPAVNTCVSEWELDGKLLTITLDKSFADDNVRNNLRGLLSIRSPTVISGQLLIGDCYARVFSSLAQIALGSMQIIVDKVRESLKYIESSEDDKKKFMDLKQQLQVSSSKSLTIDDAMKWNTTYEMLVSASELKKVFSFLKSSDQKYQETMPSVNEWKQVETLCKYLMLFFEATNILKATPYPTANVLFHEVWKIQVELGLASMSLDPFTHNLINPLKEIFDKYWNDTSLILAIAVVMDPRFKMKLIEFSFIRIYGNNADMWIRTVRDAVHDLFLEYVVQNMPAPTFIHEGNDIVAKTELPEEGSQFLNCDDLADFDLYLAEINEQVKSELDQYLEDPLLPRTQEFDVLGWWKTYKTNYPTLSKMAADVLMIPFSTVGADSAFDTVSNKMDSYRTSLQPTTLKSLICAKDWLQYGSSTSTNSIVKVEY